MATKNVLANRLGMWGIFLISPFAAFAISVGKFGYKEFRMFILVFFMLYGYTFLPIPQGDGDKYKQAYISSASTYDFSEYAKDIKSIFEGTSLNPDFYAQTLMFVSSQISDDYRVYFVLAALIYYSVLLKMFHCIWNITRGNNSRYIFFFIGCCFVLNLSAGLNGIRFPLGFWIFSYGALNLILKDKLKYLFIAASSVLVHFSMAFSLVFLIIFYFLKYTSNPKLLYTLLVIGIVVTLLFPTFLTSFNDLLGGSYESKLQAYSGEDYINEREDHVQKWNWYVQVNLVATYYFCIVAIIISKLAVFKIKFDTLGNRLFGFGMLMIMHSFLSGSLVDSISNRYYILVNLFGLIYLYYLSSINPGNKLLSILKYIYIPILIINVLVVLRGDLYTVSPILVFGNAIFIFTTEATTSIQEMFS